MVQVTISNNIRVRGLTNVKLKAEITLALTVDNPKYTDLRKMGKPTWGIDPKLKLYIQEGTDLILPRGFESNLINISAKYENEKWLFNWDLSEERPVYFGTWNPLKPLRDYQQEAIDKVIDGRNGILVAPAGSGKTNIALRYIFDKNCAALWLTHTVDLMNQTKARAEDLISGVGRVGTIGDGGIDYGTGKLIIAMVQTLRERPELIAALNPVIGTLVIDECHHLGAPEFIEVVSKFKTKNVLGITATPDRKDRLECYMYFGVGPKLHEIKREGLYDAGQLLKPEIRFIYTNFQYEQASIYNPTIKNVNAGGEDLDYHELMQEVIKDSERLKLVTMNIFNCAKVGNYQLVIAESVRYCYAIKHALDHGYPISLVVKVIHGPLTQYTWRVAASKDDAIRQVETGQALKWEFWARRYRVYVKQYSDEEMKLWQISKERRRDIMTRANDRKIDILICTQLGKEGLDLPHLNIGHLVTPKKGDVGQRADGSSVEQYLGRIQRPDTKNPNKKPIWFDYVDNKVGVFYSQYLSRRKVYKRLELTVPKAPKTKIDEIDDFLGGF